MKSSNSTSKKKILQGDKRKEIRYLRNIIFTMREIKNIQS